MPTAAKHDAPDEITLKSVIIYDDFAFLAKANATLQRVGSRSDVAARWATIIWPTSDLYRAAATEKSIIEAADAHLIVMPNPRNRVLSSFLREWLERWAALRQIQDAALAVIGDGTQGFVNTANRELTTLVQRLGLNLILDERPAASETTKLGVRFPSIREMPVSIHLHHADDAISRSCLRGFGINE